MTENVAASLSVTKRAAIGAGWVIAWRIATRNLGLFSTLILVRLLQPSDFGLVALASGFINSVDALSAIGVQDALIRAPAPDRDMYDTAFCLGVLRGGLTALIIAAIAWPVGIFFSDARLSVVMLALAAGTMISAFENIAIVDFRRNLAFRKEFDLQFWSRVAGVVVTVLLAVLWHTYWALVAGVLTNRIARLLQSYLMSPYRPRITFRAWRGLIGFSLWTWAQTMVFQARDRSDSIVVGHLLGAAQVGAFSVGLELGSLPTTEVVEPLNRVLFPGFARLHNAVGHNAAGELGNMFLGAVGLGFVLILPAGIGISMVAEPMVRLTLGQAWLVTVPVVQIMAATTTTAIFTHASGTMLNAIGRPSAIAYLACVTTALRIGCLLLLVPPFGLAGAAVAVSISMIADLAVSLTLGLSRIGLPLARLAAAAIRPAAAASAMVAVLWLLGMAWTSSNAATEADLCIDLALRCTAGAVSYTTALMTLWLVSGRPAGAERFVLENLANTWLWIKRRRFARSR